MKKQPYIFSGSLSTKLWKLINKENSMALYIMGCKCQELEELVRGLSEKK